MRQADRLCERQRFWHCCSFGVPVPCGPDLKTRSRSAKHRIAPTSLLQSITQKFEMSKLVFIAHCTRGTDNAPWIRRTPSRGSAPPFDRRGPQPLQLSEAGRVGDGGCHHTSAQSTVVPAQQRLRRHDRCQLGQNLPPQSLRPGRQPTSLVVSEPQAPVAELFAKNTVLLPQVFDHLKLALIHPSGNSDQDKLKRIQNGRHRVTSVSTSSQIRAQNLIFNKISFRSMRGGAGYLF